METNEQVWSFIAEWFDPHPQLVKQYVLKYFVESCEVEMKDLSTSRKFLKRTKVPAHISSVDFVLGGQLLLFSRDLKLVDYADNITRTLLDATCERTLLLIPPSLYHYMGRIVQTIEEKGLTLVDAKTFNKSMVPFEVDAIFQSLFGINVNDFLGDKMDGHPPPGLVLAFRGVNSIAILRQQSNEWNRSLGDKGQIYIASSPNDITKLTTLFFHAPTTDPQKSSTATYIPNRITCGVIKPHIIKSRQSGAILDAILSDRRYDITSLQLFRMDRVSAGEFLEIYDGVGNGVDFNGMVDQLCSGPVVAMEIFYSGGGGAAGEEKEEDDAVTAFRRTAGPWDVDVAKELYPDSLRGRFGRTENKQENAVHCTDLKEDALSEVQYFFQILASAAVSGGGGD